MHYETPTIEDYGTLVELTAMMDVGGPEDALQKGVGADAAPPGHTCPTGTPPAIGHGNNNNGNPPCHVMNDNGNGGNSFEPMTHH